MGPPLKCGWFTEWDPIGEKLFLLCECQVGIWVCFPSRHLPHLAWTCVGLMCAAIVMWVHNVHQPCCLKDMVSLEPSITSDSHNLSSIQPPFCIVLWPWGAVFDGVTSHLELSVTRSLALSVFQLCVSVLVPVYSQKNLLWWQLTETLLSDGESCFIAMFLDSSIWLSARLLFYTDSGSWPPKERHTWVPSECLVTPTTFEPLLYLH